MIGIGIDTGGTCTDAVVFDITERCILASAKSQTTHDHLEQGIGNSLDKLPKNCCIRHLFLHCLPHWPPMPAWKTKAAGYS